jgi:signal peptidase I
LRSRARWLFAAALIIGAAASLLRGRVALPVTRYVVDGPSMEPAYRAGDRILVNRWAYRSRAPQPGDAVIVRDPEHPSRLLLKRIAAVPPLAADGERRYFVVGDNAGASRDSRQFGAVVREAIVGKAWRRY